MGACVEDVDHVPSGREVDDELDFHVEMRARELERQGRSPDEAYIETEVEAGNAGARKTLTFVLKNENQADIGKLAPVYIAKGAVICADESDAYDLLPAKYEVRRVNHGKAYRADDGTTNNLAESYFSRFRRCQIGQIHKVAPKYLDNYANEMAYREDTRRWSNGRIFRDIVGKCARALVSRDWCGYWQGNHRLGESLAV